jgi:hypothetical protein
LLASIAGWLGQQQRDAIEENRVLREQLGDKRIYISEDHRRRLAAKAKMGGMLNYYYRRAAQGRHPVVAE